MAMVNTLDPKKYYQDSHGGSSFNADNWVFPHDGVWKTRQGYIKFTDMEVSHIFSTLGFIERSDPEFKDRKVYKELRKEYRRRIDSKYANYQPPTAEEIKQAKELKPKPATIKPPSMKRKFRLKD